MEQKKEKSIDELVGELLDMPLCYEEKDNTFSFTKEIEEKIHFIADKCRSTGIYKRSSNKIAMDKYIGAIEIDNMSAMDVYADMLEKIVKAPTRMHMWSIPRLLLPIVSDKLVQENQ
ncbi:MAG: hypothetical protein E7262_09560 [Lachnospiraceae bacterium]|nr:hypothetical protein [Lachnospiraceae bacterium]